MILLSLSHAVTTLRCEYYVSQIHNTLRCTLLLHTGSIDGMWKLSNGAVPTSWSTRKRWCCEPSVASRNWDLAMAMAPWKLHILSQSHRPRSEQTIGEVRRPKNRETATTPPAAQNPVNTTTFLQTHRIFPGKI